MIIDFAKKALAFPIVFDTYQSLVGMPECHKRFIQEILAPVPGERVLDIGCGVGASLRYIPESVDYVGIDVSEAYIAKANTNYGRRGKFICADVTAINADALGMFDRVFSVGVLHHLPDNVALRAVELVRQVVKPGGVYATIDPCYVQSQNRIAKFIIDNDRGEYVRTVADFERLMARIGPVHSEVRSDLLRIPYTQLVMAAKASKT